MNNNISNKEYILLKTITSKPNAVAIIKGSDDYPDIIGKAYFFERKEGIVVATIVDNLPIDTKACSTNIFAYHIHSGELCEGDFESAEGHYNPSNCPHPAHAGDMPPLFANKEGNAVLVFQTDRFTLDEILDRTVIIHLSPDDFTTQPSGNSGKRIACGLIKKYLKKR